MSNAAQQHRGAGVIAHQQDQIDQLVRLEQRFDPREGSRRDLVVAEDLPAEFDDRRVGLAQALRALAVLDDVDDVARHADLQGFGLVRGPFEPAVHFARDGENGDLARFRIEAGLMAQIVIDRVMRLDRLGAVKVDAGRPAQADDGLARRAGAVVGALAGIVQILAL